MFFRVVFVALFCVIVFSQERQPRHPLIKLMSGETLFYQSDAAAPEAITPLVSPQQSSSIVMQDSNAPTNLIFQDAATNPCKNNGILVEYPIPSSGNTTANVTTACLCPIDKIGNICQNVRSYQCVDKLVSPVRNCPIHPEMLGAKVLEGDLPCLMFNSNDMVQFFLSIQCHFTDPPAYVSNNIPQNATFRRVDQNISGLSFEYLQTTAFSYYLITENTTNPVFAQTVQIPTPHEFRIVNFYTFSDISQNTKFVLERENFVDGQLFNRTIWFGNLTKEYFAGQRVYIEVGYPSTYRMDPIWERFNIDFEDLPEPQQPFPLNDAIEYTGIAIACLVGVIIFGISFFCYFYNKQKKTKELTKID